MDWQNRWSIRLGCWGERLQVQLHIFFVLFAAFTLFLCWQQWQVQLDLTWLTGMGLGILLLSSFLHELGHYQAAVRFGAPEFQQVVLVPWGGLTPVDCSPKNPWAEFFVRLAGPFVNALLAGGAALLLLLSDANTAGVASLLNPLRPDLVPESATLAQVAVRLLFWINWSMLLINLLPAPPFDGGLALRSWIQANWPRCPRRTAAQWTALTGKIAALGLAIAAITLWGSKEPGQTPTWFSLILLSIFLFFGAKQDEIGQSDPMLDPMPAPPVDADLEEATFDRWFEQRRREWEIEPDEQVEDDEKRLDEILARVHLEGIQALSDDERGLLERVSQRYRQRQSPQI